MLTWLWIPAVIAVGLLGWNLYMRFGSDRIAEINNRRRPSSRMVSRGEFVDGNRHLAVALALTQSTFYYENSDMEASLDLEWVREIEYDTELETGRAIERGRVLRLRCFSQTFEFVLPNDTVAAWYLTLPPHGTVQTAAAVPQVATAT